MMKRDSNTLASKLKRNLSCVLPVAGGREGGCTSCGACCRMPYPCPVLRYDDEGRSRCGIYRVRPQSCRVYPRTPREHVTHAVCGFSFSG